MHFTPTPIHGAYRVTLVKRLDTRGFFARMFCAERFAAQGIHHAIVQLNESHNAQAGTLRGLHYQLPPYADAKIVRPVHGDMLDVIVDLRPDSPSFMQHYSTHLSSEEGSMMVIPPGCAHAFLTLTDDTDILYAVSAPYHPESERGLRYDDPALAIHWPATPRMISEKDVNWPLFDPAFHGIDLLQGLSGRA